MIGREPGERGRRLRERLDAFRETETLATAAVDELFAGLERACARVNDARPEMPGSDRLNPQHWGYSLYVYFRDRIMIVCEILPAAESMPRHTLLRLRVSLDHPRPLTVLSLERTAPAAAEWRADGERIEPEPFFFDLLESYARKWSGE